MAYLQSHYRIGKINRTIVFIHASTQFQPIERNQNEELLNFRANQIWYHNNWLSCRYFWAHDMWHEQEKNVPEFLTIVWPTTRPPLFNMLSIYVSRTDGTKQILLWVWFVLYVCSKFVSLASFIHQLKSKQISRGNYSPEDTAHCE